MIVKCKHIKVIKRGTKYNFLCHFRVFIRERSKNKNKHEMDKTLNKNQAEI